MEIMICKQKRGNLGTLEACWKGLMERCCYWEISVLSWIQKNALRNVNNPNSFQISEEDKQSNDVLVLHATLLNMMENVHVAERDFLMELLQNKQGGGFTLLYLNKLSTLKHILRPNVRNIQALTGNSVMKRSDPSIILYTFEIEFFEPLYIRLALYG